MATLNSTYPIRQRFLLILIAFCLPLVSSHEGWAQQLTKTQAEAAVQLLNQGQQQFQSNQISAAIASWQAGLILYRQAQNRQGEMTLLAQLGKAYYSTGEDEAAIAHYQQSLAIAQMLKDRSKQRIALAGLGEASYSLGDYTQAIAHQQQALMIANVLKNYPHEIQSLRNLGIAYDALGDYAKAVGYHQQNLVIARQIGDRHSESIALRNLGAAYYLLAKYPQAIAAFQQDLAALQQQDRSAVRAGEGWLLGNLAKAYYALGDYARAIEAYQQQREIARQLNDSQSEGTALSGLGIAHYYQGDYAKAIAYQQQSLALARQLQDVQTEAAALANLGSTHVSLGEYATAIEVYEQSLAIARKSQHPQSISAILSNLGRTYSLVKNHPKAIECHQQALTIARQVNDHQNEGTVLGNLGIAYHALGDTTKAISYAQQWLTIAQKIGDRQGEAAALDDVGLVHASLGNHGKAMEYTRQSLAIARQIHNQRGEGLALDHLGKAQFKSGNLAIAEQSLRSSIQVWESLRGKLGDTNDGKPVEIYQVDANKVSLFETQASTYRSLQQVLVAQKKTDAALEIAERGRTRAFVELLVTKYSTPHSLHPTSQVPSSTLSIQQIQQIAKTQNATLVEYSIIDEFKRQDQASEETALYIWVIQPTGKITFRQIDLKPSSSRQATRSSIVQPKSSYNSVLAFQASPSGIRPRMRELYEVLIQPIADLLPTHSNQRIIFIPQGSLFLVPFVALRDRNNRYLIEQHTISIAPSIQVLDLTHKHREKQKLGKPSNAQLLPFSALVVGNPAPMPKPFSPLPDAEVEAVAIAQLLKTSALTGDRATRATVLQQMPAARWIHLATHGIFDSQQGLKSAIALATTANDDGFLTAEQILDLQLSAELVVLSACNTGRGRITGDGVIGLSRALITAGVPSVIVSLWAVPDAPTAALMTAFYQNLERTPDKAQALRQAMLTTMQQNPNPLSWASFTLIGEAE